MCIFYAAADPRLEEPPHQQVLVVNMGPNGPNWRQVEDHELDDLGLDWVREQVVERKRLHQQHADDHYFIGENGHLLQQQRRLPPVPEVEEAPSCSRKRKAEEDADERPSKKKKSAAEERMMEDMPPVDLEIQPKQWNDDSEIPIVDRRVGNTLNMGCLHDIDDSYEPDEGLNDEMLMTLVNNGTRLRKLHLAGCAITNMGLRYMLNNLPSLESINIMYTHVTQSFIDDIRKSFTHVDISDARQPPLQPGECTIFCAS